MYKMRKTEGGVIRMNEIFISSIAFGLFIVCPRMAGMMHVINKNSNVSMLRTVLTGTLMSIPLLLLMVLTFGYVGIWVLYLFAY